MAPLTSPSGCVSCSLLSEKIKELEQRISTLYQIHEAEKQLDTIIFGPAQTDWNVSNVTSASGLAAAEATKAATPPGSVVTSCCPTAAVPHPTTISDNTWIKQGAKPKSLVSSTPSVPESWTLVTHRGSRERPLRSPHHNIQLENKYDVFKLDDFPSLPGEAQHPPPSPSSSDSPSPQTPPRGKSECPSQRRAHRCSIPQFTPAPQRAPVPLPTHPSPSSTLSPPANPPSPTAPSLSTPVSSRPSPPRPLFPPTTLLVGDSIIRNIRFFNAITHCFPGATVPVILEKLQNLLHTLPPSVHRIIVHVGCVDVLRRRSEITKAEFNKLLKFLNTCGKSVFISGPLSPHGRGSEMFSRLIYLNTWLLSACRAHNVEFIDNFNLFWGRKSFLKPDGIHPSQLGSRMLAGNLQHAVRYHTHL